MKMLMTVLLGATGWFFLMLLFSALRKETDFAYENAKILLAIIAFWAGFIFKTYY